MTFGEALKMADTLRANALPLAVKARWLCELEGRICTEIQGRTPDEALQLVENTPPLYRLTAPPPYDRLYWAYLVAMIDMALSDGDAYRLSEELFRQAYTAYAKWYQRTKGRRAGAD